VAQKQKTVQCEVLTDSGHTVEENRGHCDTEPTYGTIQDNDRHFTDYRKQLWTQ